MGGGWGCDDTLSVTAGSHVILRGLKLAVAIFAPARHKQKSLKIQSKQTVSKTRMPQVACYAGCGGRLSTVPAISLVA